MTILFSGLQLTGRKKLCAKKPTACHFTIRGYRILAAHCGLYAHASCRCPDDVPNFWERITPSPCYLFEAPPVLLTRRVVERGGDLNGFDEGRRRSRCCGGDRNRRDPAKLPQHKNGNRRVLTRLRSPGSGTDRRLAE